MSESGVKIGNEIETEIRYGTRGEPETGVRPPVTCKRIYENTKVIMSHVWMNKTTALQYNTPHKASCFGDMLRMFTEFSFCELGQTRNLRAENLVFFLEDLINNKDRERYCIRNRVCEQGRPKIIRNRKGLEQKQDHNQTGVVVGGKPLDIRN
ncbi:hypothetical protein EVAR_60588_1 [Eumeta japonica]|uniref:Uncharacterized protein n=1 Tax=Eumeta variegata TaxID=151549 RepID=A0A4C1YEI2_EUMVA|nr:hypothetical protein EVAR_60588_1 [Eumeta japonica]